jgi:hypothetical protein
MPGMHERRQVMKSLVHRNANWVSGHNLSHCGLLRVFFLARYVEGDIAVGEDAAELSLLGGYQTANILVTQESASFGDGLLGRNGYNGTLTEIL